MSCPSKPTTRPRKWQLSVRVNLHHFREIEHRSYGKCCCAVCRVKLGTSRQPEFSCTKCKEALHRDCLHLYAKPCAGHRAADERSSECRQLFHGRSSSEMAATSALLSIADSVMPAVERPPGRAAEAALGRAPDDCTAVHIDWSSAVHNTVIVAADRSTSATGGPVPVALVVVHERSSDETEDDPVRDTVIVANSSASSGAGAALGTAPGTEELPVEAVQDDDRSPYVWEGQEWIQMGIRDIVVPADDTMSGPHDSPEEAVPVVREVYGCCLEDFDLIEVIGCGSYGKVITAMLKGTNNIYALKAIEKCKVKTPLNVRRIYTERRVLARCSGHPFLVGLLACMQTRTHLIFVAEFASGGDLLHLLEQKRQLPMDHVRFYAAEIALAVGYLHQHGIIHRDLKPENVLLDCEGHVKVTDYGLSRDGFGENERTVSFCGSALYMAPEIVLGLPYGQSVDWWSYGIMIYEMLFGFTPFEKIKPSGPNSRKPNEYVFKAITAPDSIGMPYWIGWPAAALLDGLLCKLPCCRLCSTYDVRELFVHPFFEGLDFEQVEWRAVPPPVVPSSPWKLTESIISGNDNPNGENRDVVAPHFETGNPREVKNIDQWFFEDFDCVNDSMLMC